jgi:peroxiredoxin (alkyl hydroperoxide reductase subunit C)
VAYFFFYPADFTFVCPIELEEMAEYEEFEKKVRKYCQSRQIRFCHKAWHDTSDAIKKVNFLWLRSCRRSLNAFGTYIHEGAVRLSLRGTFIVDQMGIEDDGNPR